jgi:hypothetical protein
VGYTLAEAILRQRRRDDVEAGVLVEQLLSARR